MERVCALGLDIGLKRIGVAGCDGLGLLATELTTINRSDFVNDVEKIKQIIIERNVNILIIGLPYRMDGSIGKQAKKVSEYAKRLSEALSLPIEFVDERLTSIEAEEQLKNNRQFSTWNKGLIDKRAAEIILQQWLDNR
jgi:putative Holliday junction resolvase